MINWKKGTDAPQKTEGGIMRGNNVFVTFIVKSSVYNGKYNFKTKKFYVDTCDFFTEKDFDRTKLWHGVILMKFMQLRFMQMQKTK